MICFKGYQHLCIMQYEICTFMKENTERCVLKKLLHQRKLNSNFLHITFFKGDYVFQIAMSLLDFS